MFTHRILVSQFQGFVDHGRARRLASPASSGDHGRYRDPGYLSFAPDSTKARYCNPCESLCSFLSIFRLNPGHQRARSIAMDTSRFSQLPRLPQELWDGILDLLPVMEINMCVYVCRSWAPYAQALLFHTIEFSWDACGLRRLHDILVESPHLAQYPRKLSLFHVPSKATQGALAQVIALCTNMRRFVSVDTIWSEWSCADVTGIKAMLGRPTMESIRIIQGTFASQAHLDQLLSWCGPTVSNVELNNCVSCSDASDLLQDAPRTATITPAQPRSLEILDCSHRSVENNMRPIYAAFRSFDLSQVTALVLANPRHVEEANGTLQRVINGTKNTLVQLTIWGDLSQGKHSLPPAHLQTFKNIRLTALSLENHRCLREITFCCQNNSAWISNTLTRSRTVENINIKYKIVRYIVNNYIPTHIAHQWLDLDKVLGDPMAFPALKRVNLARVSMCGFGREDIGEGWDDADKQVGLNHFSWLHARETVVLEFEPASPCVYHFSWST